MITKRVMAAGYVIIYMCVILHMRIHLLIRFARIKKMKAAFCSVQFRHRHGCFRALKLLSLLRSEWIKIKLHHWTARGHVVVVYADNTKAEYA